MKDVREDVKAEVDFGVETTEMMEGELLSRGDGRVFGREVVGGLLLTRHCRRHGERALDKGEEQEG